MSESQYELRDILSSELHSGDIIYRELLGLSGTKRADGLFIEIFELVHFDKPKSYRYLATNFPISGPLEDRATWTSYEYDRIHTNSRFLNQKDLILYSYLKYKTSRYFELLKD
jgi:hypothetical protein